MNDDEAEIKTLLRLLIPRKKLIEEQTLQPLLLSGKRLIPWFITVAAIRNKTEIKRFLSKGNIVFQLQKGAETELNTNANKTQN